VSERLLHIFICSVPHYSTIIPVFSKCHWKCLIMSPTTEVLNTGVVSKKTTEWLHERTEHLDIFLFFCSSLNGVLFLMFCLLVEWECQILVF